MLTLAGDVLDALATALPAFAPRAIGRVTACDGGLLEVSGLAAPIGALCRINDGGAAPRSAEVIGFRGSRTLMM